MKRVPKNIARKKYDSGIEIALFAKGEPESTRINRLDSGTFDQAIESYYLGTGKKPKFYVFTF